MDDEGMAREQLRTAITNGELFLRKSPFGELDRVISLILARASSI